MKKNLWLAALVGVALTGCVNEEVAPEAMQKDVLTFSAPVMTTQSRAKVMGEINGVQYDVREEFKVYCKSYKGSFTGWNSSSDIQDYFNTNGDVAKNEGNNSKYWATSSTYYWPDHEFSLAFAAYSPADLGSDMYEQISMTGSGLDIKGFKVNGLADKQYDLMYSSRVFDRNRANNQSHAVGLLFHHALSSIVFSTEKEDESVEYEITDLKLKGDFIMTANFCQNIVENPTEGSDDEKTIQKTKGKAAWTYTYNSGSEDPVVENITFDPSFFKVVTNDEGTEEQDETESLQTVTVTTVPTQFTQGESALLLIPQDVNNTMGIELHYTKKYKVKGENSTEKEVTTQNIANIKLADFAQENDNKITKWEMGKRYVYRISFGQNKRIYFEPSTENWVQEPTLIYTIQ